MSTAAAIFFSPTDAFDSIRERPRWLLHAAIVVGVSIGIAFFLMPFAQQAVFRQLAPHVGVENARQAVALSREYQYMNIVVVPAMLFLKWLFLTAVLFFAAELFSAAEPKFRSVFSLVVNAEYILILMALINIVILHARGVGAVSGMHDLQSIAGIDLFFRGMALDAAVVQLLRSVNVFNVWYIVLLALGVAKICGITPWKSSLVLLVICSLNLAAHYATSLMH